MSYRLTYHPEVKRTDLPKIDSRIRRIIKRAIEERLATRPEVYGKPLQRTLKGYWKLRVGDYRIVFKPSGETVQILGIVHRKDLKRHFTVGFFSLDLIAMCVEHGYWLPS